MITLIFGIIIGLVISRTTPANRFYGAVASKIAFLPRP